MVLWIFLLTSIIVKSINLLGLPLYLDEGIYISWAKLLANVHDFAYVSLQDGKTPLFFWLIALINPLFHNSLLTGRLISVVAGSITAVCWLIFLKQRTGSRSVLFGAIIFLVTPYIYLIERMAFVDSLLVCLSSISLLCLSSKKFLITLLAGFFIGLAYMTKTSAKLLLLANSVVGIFWLAQLLREKKRKQATLLILSLLITLFVYHEIAGYLRFGGYRLWSTVALKESQLTFSVHEILEKIFITHDLGRYKDNLFLVKDYLLSYLGGILILFIFGTFQIMKLRVLRVLGFFSRKRFFLIASSVGSKPHSFRDLQIKKDSKATWLLLYLTILAAGTFLSAKIIASRYFYPLVPAVIIISSIGAAELFKNAKGRLLVIVILGISIIQSLLLIVKPLNAVYSFDDSSYFKSANLSALGLFEVATYIKSKTASRIGVLGYWGVAEGSVVILQEAGINAVKLSGFGNLDVDYIYLTDEGNYPLKSLKKIKDFEIVKQFYRPGGENIVYLIKLK